MRSVRRADITENYHPIIERQNNELKMQPEDAIHA